MTLVCNHMELVTFCCYFIFMCRAFCNPADVEAFTEEKKQSLLTKRHAKGSDFVRAVKEIIESYENLKQQEQAGDPQSAEEATLESVGNTTLLPQVSENPTGTSLDTQMKSDPSNGRDESTLLSEDASAAEQMLALRDNSVPCNKAGDIAVVKEPLKIATYSSRRRNGGARSQKCAPQKICSVQRSKSSSRVQSDKLQRSMLQNSDGGQSIDDVEDVALRRRKRIRRSPGHSESDDVASSALNSHASDEENASEIATVESDNNVRNEGNGVDSDSKVEHSDIGGQLLEGDYEVNKGLNFQINTMVKRKKRKPTRKRGTSDVVDPPAKVEANAVIEDRARENVQASQNSHEGFTERPSEENGDEHLPLVKRARVRMSRAFYGDHEANGSSQVEERSSKDTLVSATAQTSPSDIISSHDTYAAEESKIFEVSAKLSADIVNVVPSPEEKPFNGMSPSEACVQTVGGGECAMGWNELRKAPDDEAARPQTNQVSSSPAGEAQIASVPEAACSGDSQPMKLPTSESDLPVVQCLRKVAKSETPLEPNTVNSSANKATGICSSGIPSHLPGQHRSQDQDACDILDNSRESLSEKSDKNDVCVAQAVQSEAIEHSPSSCLMVNKQETENMQKNLLLKEEHGSLGEEYDNVKPIQTTPNPPISAAESDVIVDESEPPNETGYSICGDVVENSRQLEIM